MSPSSPGAVAAPASPFPNFLQMPQVLPRWAWRVLRTLSVGGALAVAALLVLDPSLGLPLFWGLIVPALPLVFMLTPGLWRNVCPLATSNQAPRRLGLTRPERQRALATGAAFPLGIALFIAAIAVRKLWLNASGPATAALIVGAMALAALGGLLFKGKSGWCSSICPLLPVQRLYGQTPFIKVANTQCEPCVGCAKNCYDFSPASAYLADQYDADPRYRDFRRFFAGVFPGLILGFYLVPGPEAIGPAAVVGELALHMACSLAAFTVLDLLFKATPNRMPVLSAALSINLYYLFAAPVVLSTVQHLGLPIDAQLDAGLLGALRAAVLIATAVWIARSMRAERQFLREQVRQGRDGEINLAPVVVETVRLHRHIVQRPAPDLAPVGPDSPAANAARLQAGQTEPGALTPVDPVPRPPAMATRTAPSAAGANGTLTATATAIAAAPGLHIQPDGRCVPLRTGVSLLDQLEGCGAAIQAGCRAGACGADPIAVTGGADCLGPVGSTERATLARLGHAPNTRLACMARVRQAGAVTVELRPHAAGAVTPAPAHAATVAPSAAAEPAVPHDPAIRRVVIVGNGVAGLTAAQTLRRHHPDCEIHLIARERHLPYNRVAISGLIHQRSGLQGLTLQPEAWFADQRITQWLNTRVAELDLDGRTVRLATGESLAWDRLILATGAQAWLPPIEGYGVPGSYLLRHANDAMAIRAYAQRHAVRRAVVVGAGLLGIEVAAALRRFGLAVQVLSLNDRVLDRQIDAAASARVVAHLQGQGIELLAHANLRRVLRRDGRVDGLTLQDGRTLPAELVVVCAGTRPDLALARAAGLATAKGVVVDAQMRTSAPDVYAAGDVAEFEGRAPGLWPVAQAQGEVAARAALGLPALYESVEPVLQLKLPGLSVASAGLAEAQGPQHRELSAVLRPLSAAAGAVDGPTEPPAHVKLVIERSVAAQGAARNAAQGAAQIAAPEASQAVMASRPAEDRVVGAVIVGDLDEAEDLLAAAQQRLPLASLRQRLPGLRWALQLPLSVPTPLDAALASANCAAARAAAGR